MNIQYPKVEKGGDPQGHIVIRIGVPNEEDELEQGHSGRHKASLNRQGDELVHHDLARVSLCFLSRLVELSRAIMRSWAKERMWRKLKHTKNTIVAAIRRLHTKLPLNQSYTIEKCAWIRYTTQVMKLCRTNLDGGNQGPQMGSRPARDGILVDHSFSTEFARSKC